MKLVATALFVACLVTGHPQASPETPWKWQEALVPDVGFDLDQGPGDSRDLAGLEGKRTLRKAVPPK